MTIEELWVDFEFRVIHPLAPPDQTKEMRRAFYAGAMGALAEPIDDHQIRGELMNECKAFAKAVREG